MTQQMVAKVEIPDGGVDAGGQGLSIAGDIIIANAPDPVFVSDLEGKILKANEAVFALLGLRPDELIEQSLSRIISPEETREFSRQQIPINA